VRRSPDWSLQLDSMKSESLVIVDQNATVNTFPRHGQQKANYSGNEMMH